MKTTRRWTTEAVRAKQAKVDGLWRRYLELKKEGKNEEAAAVKAEWTRVNEDV